MIGYGLPHLTHPPSAERPSCRCWTSVPGGANAGRGQEDAPQIINCPVRADCGPVIRVRLVARRSGWSARSGAKVSRILAHYSAHYSAYLRSVSHWPWDARVGMHAVLHTLFQTYNVPVSLTHRRPQILAGVREGHAAAMLLLHTTQLDKTRQSLLPTCMHGMKTAPRTFAGWHYLDVLAPAGAALMQSCAIQSVLPAHT
jgi:hypothetical protein